MVSETWWLAKYCIKVKSIPIKHTLQKIRLYDLHSASNNAQVGAQVIYLNFYLSLFFLKIKRG
jgi:hypothetical protein